MIRVDAADVHAALGDSGWLAALEQLGVAAEYLRNRHGPCPLCAGKDRYRFDNKGRGAYYCNGCGAGDGFKLLQRLHGWDFPETLKRVAEIAGITTDAQESRRVALPNASGRPNGSGPTVEAIPAAPSRRVLEIRRGSCAPSAVPDVVDYLTSRSLWPLATDCALRGHASVEYWESRERLGRFSALLADVVDINGALVTMHVTYLRESRKLADHEPRKILTKLEGRAGCSVRLMPLAGDTLGIGEGIETMLAAHQLHDLPTWAALNTSLLAKFEPPGGVRTLVVFADRDVPGLEAAARLFERLQGRVRLELCVPAAPAKDWNDVLMAQGGK